MTIFSASVMWQVFDLSGSAFQLGLIGLVRFVPHLALSLLAGAFADTYDRRSIAMLAQIVPAGCAITLFVATTAGSATLPLIYGLVFAIAVAAAFEAPAGSALFPTPVRTAVFPNAVTISTTLTSLARVTGPAVAGLVIAEVGVGATYAVQASLIAGSLVAFAFIRTPAQTEARSTVSLESIREGIQFLLHKREVLGAMTLDMLAVIFGGAQALLPVYANEILKVGPRGYGILTSSLEAGALLMAGLLVALPPIRRVGRALLIAVAVFGAATALFGLSRSFPLSVFLYMLVGMADQVSVVARHTLIQLSTPDELRGRVSSVNMVFIGASNHLGAVEAGFVAAMTSATFAVVSGGLGCLVALGVVAAKIPELASHEIGGTPADRS